MRGFRLAVASALMLLAAGVLAAPSLVGEIQAEFKMGFIYPRATTNLQAFSGALGGATAAPITQSNDPKRPFEVGGDTFTDFQSAANRACDNQHNECAQLSNSKVVDFPVGDCDKQTEQCKAAASTATQTAFQVLASQNAEFDFFCDA